jgi:hypothetical protein
MTLAVNIAQSGSNNVTFRNRIINGACVIDQRNAGASITANNSAFGVDRFKTITSQSSKLTVQQNAGSITPPAGFTNYLGYTSSSAYSVLSDDFFFIAHNIEGYNFSDLAWGTANAATVTLSFRVYSSLTGTFGGALRNSGFNRSYPFSYTISTANTWTTISVTIVGDTSGTWIGATNGIGLQVAFSLGMGSTYSGTAGAWASANYASTTGATSVVGTNGATFYITGVQLEAGTTASPFEYRQYGTELALCQRYFQLFTCTVVEWIYNEGNAAANKFWQLYMGVPMRSAPTATYSSGMTGGAVVGFSGTVSSLALQSASVNRVVTRVTMSTNTGTANLMYHCDTFDNDTVGLSSEL